MIYKYGYGSGVTTVPIINVINVTKIGQKKSRHLINKMVLLVISWCIM